ncbi:hypothetical protein BD289DRAFT_285725 [Coniella lustricola]|uniref:Uncharacterized protein n=1 Tax=Coniella lustricola TaxID=2025994 RepID=A0A2T3AK64_9PEZI|nr:hypothetical protein BD289DRAFT_285725 [Coniella lustricola]
MLRSFSKTPKFIALYLVISTFTYKSTLCIDLFLFVASRLQRSITVQSFLGIQATCAERASYATLAISRKCFLES